MNFKSTLTILFLLLSKIFFSQVKTIEISWKTSSQIFIEDKLLFQPQFENSNFDNAKPLFFIKEKIHQKNLISTLSNYTTELASKSDIEYFEKLNIRLPEELEIFQGCRSERNSEFFVLSLFPFIQQNGLIYKIKSLSFLFSSDNEVIAKDYANESVLRSGSGKWYKIGINKDGIYKIDRSFLENCGINVNGLDPNSIHLYGNGDGQLPELNSLPRKDDLVNNAIQIIGDQDGNFDENDYILFYGVGPHKWYNNGTSEFDQKHHLYSDEAYYFININSNVEPLRIENENVITDPSNVEITSYDYRDIFENDLINLVSGGQRWYGDLFDSELERIYNFSIPNIDTAAVKFKTAIATNSPTSAGTSQKYSVNGLILLDAILPAAGVDFARSTKSFQLNNPTSSIPLKLSITRSTPNTFTYLDRILLNTRRKLVFYGTQFGFRNLTDQQVGVIANYSISSFPNSGFVWDVSDVNMPKIMNGEFQSSVFSFKTEYTYKEFIASNGSSFYTPNRIGPVSNQNLHALEEPNLLIVSNSLFLNQAERLANLHRDHGLIVHVVTPDQIYNEFSSGAPDPTSIKMMSKMFYQRGVASGNISFNSLLLFGDGTFDPKNRVSNNNNMILTYQMENSENHIEAMVTDDYYGMLDDNEAIAPNDLMDIGVGRILATDYIQAKQQVDKIEHYLKNGSSLYNTSNTSCCLGSNNENTFGDWKTKFVQIADDEENGYFINMDTEPQYNLVKSNHFEMNCDKLYLDAYPQEVTAGGQRFPEVFDAITNRVQRGALIVNYVGHGGEVGLAEERVVTIPQINSWGNINSLHLFVSATCEFTKYDDPSRVSAGEWLSLNPTGGAIALMTTTRSVYFGVNSATGQAFYSHVFERQSDGTPLTFGEIMRRTKNDSGSTTNKRSFTLIGDPALKIGLPRYNVFTDSINGKDPLIIEDTLRALSKITIKGHLESNDGNLLSSFNGTISPSIYDKPKTIKTLAQDPDSPEISFELQRNIVYKGKASVTNGKFEFSFVVPKDISLSFGRGKISYYAENGLVDAQGYDTNFRIGGINPNGISDDIGPEVLLYMNDYSFVDGSITDNNPVLIVKANDENGINTVGNGIGHDLTAILDGNTAKPIILNDYYAADLNSYQSGEVRYQFSNLTPGPHTIEVKVWDVNNNSTTMEIRFVVQNKEEPFLTRVLNYPNPFTSSTSFMFEHNQSCSSLDVQVQVMTVSGKLVKTIQQTISTQGFRVEGLQWDGKDEFGDQLAKGVYLYRIKVRTPDGLVAEKTEKLAILR